jgi:hypothetical protein
VVDEVERLTQLLATALQRQAPPRFNQPKYDGSSDVELFITQFNDVKHANNWGRAETLLHLRSCLEKDAIDCGRGEDYEEVLDNLRARFGLSVRQARDRLSALRREPNQSLHSLGVEVKRLVRLAYPTMAPADRTILAVEALKKAIDNRALSRHLLALQCETVESVVLAAEEYFQVAGSSLKPRSTVAVLGREGPTPNSSQAQPMENEGLMARLVTALEQSSRVLAQFAAQNQVAAGSGQNQPARTTRSLNCHKCGSPDHWKRNCPLAQTPKNEEGPQ